MIYGVITSVLFILAFAYIVLALANKETGNMKLAGQVIAVLVALVAVVILFYGATGRGHYGMMGRGMTGEKGMKCEMMIDMMKKNPSMMDEMMKNKDMRQMMQKKMMKYGK
jgi:hypothetical protein